MSPPNSTDDGRPERRTYFGVAIHNVNCTPNMPMKFAVYATIRCTGSS